MKIKLADESDVIKLIPVVLELRPNRTVSEVNYLLPLLFRQGYKIVYIGDEITAFSILGFRISLFLFSGKTLIIDDLCTLESQRKRGYAGQLFSWIKQHAKEMECEHLCLNSRFHRKDAYRFYLNEGLFLESLHFGRRVAEL